MGTKKSNKLYAAAAALAVTASAVAPGLSADAATKVTVKSVVNPASISHYGGYANSVKKLSLPKTVKVMLSNKKTENRSVKWGKVAYDAKYVGKYQTITGTVSGTSLKATIKVKLNNYPVDVVEPKLAPVAVGEAVKLPSTITVKYKDGKSIARSIKSFTISKADTSKAGKMKLSYSYKGLNLEIKGSIAYEVKSAEITNVMDSVKEDTLSVSADVKYPAKGAKAQLLIFAGKDESKGLAPIEGKIENGKFMAEGKMIPDGTHSYKIKVGDVVSAAKEFKVDNVVKLQEVKAVTSKSLKVKFNKAVTNDAKATFEVKKDGVKINISGTPVWNQDKTEATVELSSKITKGEYTVNVGGLVEGSTLSGSVVAQDEKVAKIEVLTKDAPLVNTDSEATADDVTAAYKVTNQYGEDITKTTSVVTSSGLVDPSKGLVTFADGYNTTTNKTVAFTIINVESGISTSAVVNVVSASVESSVEIVGLYNKDGKTLTETTDLTKDKFFLEIAVKDQYGNVIKSPVSNSLLLSETNNTIVNVDDVNQIPAIDTTTVDGKVLIQVNAPSNGIKAGESTVTIIAKNTGKSSSTTVKVAEGVRANNVTLGQPSLVASGEDALIPVTALDKEGKEITDLNILNSSARGLNVGANTLVKVDGKVFLKVSNPSVGPNVALVTVVPTQTIVTSNYTVRAAAQPAVITGLDSDVQTSINTGLTEQVSASDLVIEDQYGRVMTDTQVNAWLNVTDNALVLKSSKETTDNSPFEVIVTGTPGDAASKFITSSNQSFTVTAKANAANQVATEKMTFALSTDGGANVLPSTAKEVVFSKVGIVDFASFEVKAPSVIFNDLTQYDFKVYGVKADGSKVLLKSDQYNLIAPAGFTVSGTNNNVVALSAALANTVIVENSTTVPLTKDFNFRVVVANSEATTIDKKVTVSAKAREEVNFAASSTGVSTGTALTSLSYEASVGTNDADLFDLIGGSNDTLNLAVLENNLYYIDQYGKETVAPINAVKLTFSNIVEEDGDGSAVVTNNGEGGASVTGLEVGDTLKVKVENNGVVKEFAVVVK